MGYKIIKINENYTSGIQKILKYAKEEAIRLDNTFVGSEHLLLGIIKDTNGKAYNLLNAMTSSSSAMSVSSNFVYNIFNNIISA